eukprot:scaffold6739_cov64-Phaeocystis_antarctica.AAC.2
MRAPHNLPPVQLIDAGVSLHCAQPRVAKALSSALLTGQLLDLPSLRGCIGLQASLHLPGRRRSLFRG